MNDYIVGQKITDFFAVKKSGIGNAKNGTRYLDLLLSDGHQEIPAKQWDYTGTVPQVDTVINVQAIAGSYQGQIQFTIQKWQQAQPGECNPSKFIPVCSRGESELLDDFFNLAKMVDDGDFSNLLSHVVSSPIFDAYSCAPGAKEIHHAYLHGLLEHSIDVTKKALAMADHGANEDLLITGGLLHDIGKIHEYNWTGCTIKRTPRGKLIGHVALGLLILDDIWRLSGILGKNQEKQLLLYHVIASHHGKLEWGSLVEPQTREAIILHSADMLDYQSFVIDKAITEASPGSKWTDKVVGIGREFYVSKLEEEIEEVDFLYEQN